MEEMKQTPQSGESTEKREGAVPEVSQNARNMAILSHLLGFFTCFVGPLIIWIMNKDEDAYIDQQSKEALNFQITIVIAFFATGVLSFLCIGRLLFPVLGVVDLVFVIMACMATSKGQTFRYPVSIRLIR